MKKIAVIVGPRSHIIASGSIPPPQGKAKQLHLIALPGHGMAKVMRVIQPETCRNWVLLGLNCQLKFCNGFCSNDEIVRIECDSLHFHDRESAHFHSAAHNEGRYSH